MNFIRKRRDYFFSHIKDFSNPQDELRNSPVTKLSYGEWFWFHPSAYSLISIGQPVVSFIFYCGVTIYSITRYRLLVIIFGFLALYTIKFIKQSISNYIMNKKNNNHVTYYDMYIRDYGDE